jgi:hypothetical protein
MIEAPADDFRLTNEYTIAEFQIAAAEMRCCEPNLR